jgi:hypothetical protein
VLVVRMGLVRNFMHRHRRLGVAGVRVASVFVLCVIHGALRCYVCLLQVPFEPGAGQVFCAHGGVLQKVEEAQSQPSNGWRVKGGP